MKMAYKLLILLMAAVCLGAGIGYIVSYHPIDKFSSRCGGGNRERYSILRGNRDEFDSLKKISDQENEQRKGRIDIMDCAGSSTYLYIF